MQTAVPGACSKQGPANVPLDAGWPSDHLSEEQTTSSLEAHSSCRDVPGAWMTHLLGYPLKTCLPSDEEAHWE